MLDRSSIQGYINPMTDKGLEITAEMVEAGLRAYHDHLGFMAPILASEEMLVTEIFSAMSAAATAIPGSRSGSRNEASGFHE
jgi:hypothetical protein